MTGAHQGDTEFGRVRRAVVVWRWLAAAGVAMTVHAVMGWLTLASWQVEAAGDPPSMVMIEMSALPSAPDVPPQEAPPGPQSANIQPQTESEPPPSEQVETPKLPEAPNAEVVLPPSLPEPLAKPKEADVKKPVETRKPAEPKKKQVAQQASAPPSERHPREARAAAPLTSAAQMPSISTATWRSQVMGHLNRFKREPAGARSGSVAQVAFAIDRAGRVLSASLVKSSGDSALDREATSLPRRASPVPAPPESVGGGSIRITVPVSFTR